MHNVSHKDMVVGVQRESGGALGETTALARPKFSRFQAISNGIVERLVGGGAEGKRGDDLGHLRLRHFPERVRDRSSPRHFVPEGPAVPAELPGGVDLTERRLPIQSVEDFKFRNDEDTRRVLEGRGPGDALSVTGVFFPLLAVLLPKWEAALRHREPESVNVRRIVVLVSGVGEPRNAQHRIEDNSTEGTALAASLFLSRTFPQLEVIRCHSQTNIFRYGENLRFVKNELLPLLAGFRDATARRHGSAWRERLRITVSFADGSPARISAIHAALRPYKPTFMHIWQLQTFWHERKMCRDDVEVLSFADVDTTPAVSSLGLRESDEEAFAVCEEMKRFRGDFVEHVLRGRGPFAEKNHDLDSFWMRKSRKVVLAVLAVRKPAGGLRLYRGTNMEVSMPTGSLCAERNVIGTALAADLTLKRRDLRMVAVLSVNLKDLADADNAPPKVRGPAGFAVRPAAPAAISAERGGEFCVPVGGPAPAADAAAGDEQTPTRRTKLRSLSVDGRDRESVVTTQPGDLNPLKPCGACMEWLRKIAEVNPRFRVLTFTDKRCTGVYREHVFHEAG